MIRMQIQNVNKSNSSLIQKNIMILSNKNKFQSRPIPALQFDNFLKARSQKQSIIQSDTQPILSKVQSFYQLLKLTKTGQTIQQQYQKTSQNNQLKNKSSSSKTINTFSYLNHNQFDLNKFDDVETDQAQIKKLNKMVFGLQEWQEGQQKSSLHIEKNNCHAKSTTHYHRKKPSQNKQLNAEDKIKQRKKLAYSSCDGKKFRKFYTPLKKHQAKAQLNKINSQFIKTSAQINYPQSLLNCNIFTKDTTHFKDLKSKIKMLQQKAKNQYGLDFQQKNFPNERKNYAWNDSKDNSEQKQNDYLDFSDLELGPMLSKDMNQKYQDAKTIHKQNTFNDTSIPKSFIDIVVQQKGDSLHLGSSSSGNKKWFDFNGDNKGKLKKGYLSRPKTFKPTYTYSQI